MAARYHETGEPTEVVRVESVPVAEPANGEVTVRLLASPIHPSDLGMLAGTYGRKADLPAIGGREGLGEVVASNAALAVGTRVRMPVSGAWIGEVTVAAAGLTVIPGDLPVDQAAMAFVNPPTVVRLLADFIDLQAGDWVAQNAANSAVGHGVAALARHRGLHTINVVRDPAKWEAPLKTAGGDVVVADGDDWFKQVTALTGGARPRLALNSIGGDSVIKLIRALGDGGCCVTFGGMVGDKVRYPTRNLIFNDVSLRGFWMDRWMRTHAADEIAALHDEVFDLLRQGIIQAPVAARYPLSQAKEALRHASSGGREGKVLLVAD